VPRAELLAELEAARVAIRRGLAALPEARLDAPYPEAIGGHQLSHRVFLVHLASHLAYHLGQLDYHRRLVTGDRTSVGALAAAELPSVGAPAPRLGE